MSKRKADDGNTSQCSSQKKEKKIGFSTSEYLKKKLL